jgi:hypothetical protein
VISRDEHKLHSVFSRHQGDGRIDDGDLAITNEFFSCCPNNGHGIDFDFISLFVLV